MEYRARISAKATWASIERQDHTIMKQVLRGVAHSVIPESRTLRYLTYVGSLRRWRQTRAGSYRILGDREALYEYVNKEVLGNGEIDYLEFGVYRGESLMAWVQLNSNPNSRFYGFDTFTGHPEAWQKFSGTVKEGTFDAGGALPRIADGRVSFYKGLFRETLAPFLKDYRGGRTAVVHNDCDLYSATLYVLTQVDRIAKHGTIIIFDEFTSLLDEFRALEDYCAAYRRNYEVVASTPHNIQIAIRLL